MLYNNHCNVKISAHSDCDCHPTNMNNLEQKCQKKLVKITPHVQTYPQTSKAVTTAKNISTDHFSFYFLEDLLVNNEFGNLLGFQ